jgi:hypothetical protein
MTEAVALTNRPVTARVIIRARGGAPLKPALRPWATVFPVWILLIASVISWRRGVLYDGSLDPVVLAKAAVSVIALAAAAYLAYRSPLKRRIGVGPLYTVVFISAVSTLGALTGTSVSAAAVLAVRLLIVVATLLFIARVFDTADILATLLAAMGAVGVFAAITGFHLFIAGERLQGGIPPLQPNELATLVIAPFVGVVFTLIHLRIAVWNVTATAILGFIIFGTGSRTGLAVALLSVFLVVLLAPKIPRPLALGIIIFIPVVYAVVTLTGVIEKLALRGAGVSSLLTLNSRTNAWDVVLNIPTNSWQRWIGAGLDVKTVAVAGQYWNRQVLDSSWISSLAESGVIGTVALAGLVIFVLLRSFRAHPLRPLIVALVTLTAVRSFLENGLIESSATFVVFFTIAILVDPGTRELTRRRPLKRWSDDAGAYPPNHRVVRSRISTTKQQQR